MYRVYWIIILIVSTICCSIQIINAFTKWRENPIDVGFDERLVPVSEIPFPAITVCDPLLFVNGRPFDYYNTYYGMTKNGTSSVPAEFLDIFELMSETCARPIWSGWKKIELSRIYENTTLTGEKIDNLFQNFMKHKLLSTCSGVINDGWWGCKQGFTPIMTQRGMCWTFNMISKNELVNDGV